MVQMISEELRAIERRVSDGGGPSKASRMSVTWDKSQSAVAIQSCEDEWDAIASRFRDAIERVAPGVFSDAAKTAIITGFLETKVTRGGI